MTAEHPWAKKLWLYRKLLSAAEFLVTISVTLLLLAGGIADHWASLAMARWPSPIMRSLAFALPLALAYAIPGLPFSVARHVLEKRFGLSTQSLGAWLKDQLKGLALGAVLGAIVLCGLVGILLHAGTSWWWVSALAAMAFGVLLTRLAPQLIVPIFFKMKPLDSPELQTRFTELGKRTGTPVLGIYEIDLSRKTTAANAAVIGFGASRRAVVGDTLLSKFTHDEIEFVLAHELAHHKYHDLWTGIALSSGLSALGLAFADRVIDQMSGGGAAFTSTGAAFNPLVLYWIAVLSSLAGAVLGPISKWASRHAETRADRFASEATGKARAGAEAFRKLGNQNLARFRPPAWEELLFHTHPSIGRRIERLEVSKF